MTKILIVDDEAAAGNILRILIDKYLPVEKEIMLCQQPQEAVALIAAFRPDLLMLDIEMPGMNGFDLLNKLGHWDFDVIFTTAFDQYAIKAIRFSAMDYLLKPIDIVDLQNALNKHIIHHKEKQTTQAPLMQNLMQNLKQNDKAQFKLAISTMEGVFFVHPSDIIRLEGLNNYTRFFFKQQKPLLVSKTLKEYDEILSDHDFVRVHKSHLVNKHCVQQLDKEGFLIMQDGSSVTVSRRRKDEVIQWFRQP